MSGLIAPHGGALVNLVVSPERAKALKDASRDWRSWTLTERQLCDLELLASGGFSPLTSFLGRADYESVVNDMRLANGTLWPIPVVLDLPEAVAGELKVGDHVALRDAEGFMLAAIEVAETWRPDREHEAKCVYGTTDPHHAGVGYLLKDTNPVYVSGKLEVVSPPVHHDFVSLRKTPAAIRAELEATGQSKIVAFQTRNPMHRAHQELTIRAGQEVGAAVLVHPVVGLTKPGDVDYYTRVRCYQAMMARYPENSARLALLPLAMRMGGPREAVWHAIIRKNHGCTHLIVGRDHAGPGSDKAGKPYYGPYEAQELLEKHQAELGVAMVPFKMMTYVERLDRYMPIDQVPQGEKTLDISGTELRDRLTKGDAIPEWFTFPEVATELRRTFKPLHERGFTVFFTGLSGSGKSTLANSLHSKLVERLARPVTVLDGDLVRKNLSSELGFSKEHRDLNIKRIGYVAAEITKHGGIAICCPIAPYDAVRKECRKMVSETGGFVLVHVSTPVETCEVRDRKGLYAKARAGVIKEFTGISDPYEVPADADLSIDTTTVEPEAAAVAIMGHLEKLGYVR